MKAERYSFQSYAYVGIQFFCLGLIFATGPWIARNPILLFLEIGGVVLGLWAVMTMKLRNLTAFPDMNPQRPLQQKGPYRWIRHPMYAALLLVTLAVVCEEWSWWRGLFWLCLLVDLCLKLQYEEASLQRVFPEYADYQKRTSKLIPGIW